MKYGFGFQGSKSRIAKDIIDQLPSGKRFVDLFGGGFAMSHCALLSGKYESVYYNDADPLVVDCLKRAIAGDYDITRWVSREEFQKLKEKNGQMAVTWSFGNAMRSYLYHKNSEDTKMQGHNFCCFGEKIPGIDFECSETDISKRRMALCKWAKTEFDRIMLELPELKDEYKKYLQIVNNEALPPVCAVEFTTWLRSTGITARECNELTETQMSSHWLCTKVDGQPSIPTEEMFDKLRASPKIKEVPPDILDLVYDVEKVKKLKYLDKMQHLQRLQRLEHLQHLERLEITCKDYREYKYQAGDVVYCDSPYGKDYYDYRVAFDFDEYLNWVAAQAFDIYFSSYPIEDERFECIWSKGIRGLFTKEEHGKIKTECLYLHKGGRK